MNEWQKDISIAGNFFPAKTIRLRATMKFRWLEVDSDNNSPTITQSYYGNISQYKLQQWWSGVNIEYDGKHGEWRDIEIVGQER